MKKILFVLIVFGFALLSAESFVVRLENPQRAQVIDFIRDGYDVAAYKPDAYLDLVVDQSRYENLLALGHELQITQTEKQLRSNLGKDEDLDGYRYYDEMLADLQLFEALYPSICHLYDIGDSRGKEYSTAGNAAYDQYDHEIWAMKVSDNVNEEEDEPGIYYMGEHHAREPISLEMSMTILEYLLTNYGVDPAVTDYVDHTQIWFIPLVNPNGHKVVVDEMNVWWRKNICDNNVNGNLDTGNNGVDGVDPNRNYGWEWGGASNNWSSETFQGTEAFSEPETQAVRDLLSEHHFIAGISYHTYGEEILYPYGYAEGIAAPDDLALADLAEAMASSIPGLNGGYYTPEPSWVLYPTTGGTDDYAYGEYGIFAYTIEMATSFIPSAAQVPVICNDNLTAALLLLDRINHASLQGHITDFATGEPLEAEIFIEGIDDNGEFRNPYMSNGEYGAYYRLLTEGVYNVTFSAYGYEDVTVENVVISDDASTILDVAMTPANPDVTVSGTITDAVTGLPLAGAIVELPDYNLIAVADDNGDYEISDLYAFTYEFVAHISDYASSILQASV
nr:M14 family zinc carboxypeptidase [Candidatus Cloacimonadota bacterium]